MHYRIIQDDARRLKDYIDEPIDLVVTSPPYWDIKDYGVDGQIGHGQEYDEYIKDLVHIFSACVDVIEPGGRICINVGEQYLSSSKYGRYRIQPIPHDLTVGLMQARNDIDYMGSIIWNKISNQNPSGGGKWMGSTYWPTEILFTFEHEYILIFRKHGKMPDAGDAILAASKLTKEERSEWSRGIWQIPAVRGSEHPAPFPKELATRLIKMYSYFAGTVLDPFLGSGTTMEAAIDTKRACIGFEISEEYVQMAADRCSSLWSKIEVVKGNAQGCAQPGQRDRGNA